MTMTFFLHDSIDWNGAFDRSDYSFHPSSFGGGAREDVHILKDKLRVPESNGQIERPRINLLLKKSVSQFPATLISGRAGTGKTALAAGFAARYENVAWFSVESSDISWPKFARYFSECLPGRSTTDLKESLRQDPDQAEVAQYLVRNASRLRAADGESALIVLDDIHHIFDAEWFDDFFKLLLYSLPAETHLLLLCRSKPPGPLWRLRSKQMLNLIDEKIIAFNQAETEALFDSMSLSRSRTIEAHHESFGRISKLLQFVHDRYSSTAPSLGIK
jgi:LuxR family maltose regulon positive regulatory protein